MMLKLMTAVAIVASVPALALASPSCTKEPKSKWMSENAMKAKIDTLGYKVKTFEVTGNCYEIYGKDKEGKRAEVYFNPVSGDIVQKGD
ncbi:MULTISPECIES: PepSY domain-containing protein [unclassified Rhizobium]|uniref:PepSY domain-containing protein n=1 Tax=unclassified Rhizobium TaxID=2613769 RepID=UPI001A996195|nr:MULTISPECIES: PepSY domain-containing protein [unclassified Rhizobium]MBX5167467.1 PepSY domain-containing protein [Rhizobium sp. NZLR4b]MBX5173091.1 PepSY domain-containing protein [Rhizobium sp. NZLR1b]MBX5198522.1 PepSY domain-containing protein [Rhizobium sp. NZLR10]MBX5204679.1 PepSY domain-containing protein [Rhizobium sp. NZLR1]MBX5210590.1 PepSY domain-containing protein [Rhizobium sp. NZLR11]